MSSISMLFDMMVQCQVDGEAVPSRLGVHFNLIPVTFSTAQSVFVTRPEPVRWTLMPTQIIGAAIVDTLRGSRL